MAFSFNFSGDDIEPELDAGDVVVPQTGPASNHSAVASSRTIDAPAGQVKAHDLKEWVRIFYQSHTLFYVVVVQQIS